MDAMQWHVFCRVVDNFGDIGFAWRLAADLAGRGERVRLAVDDGSALAWLAPDGAEGVSVVDWRAPLDAGCDVVVETFGCGIPEAVLAQAEAMRKRPVNVNVEHLSAETYAERSHGLPSPRVDSRGGVWNHWFFFPGFDAGSGGLLREPQLLTSRRRFDRTEGEAWLARHGVEREAGERCVSLFCYRQPALDALLTSLSDRPTLLLTTPGAAHQQVAAVLGPRLRLRHLHAVAMPAMAQADFDRLLWSCDLNLVRGEDSFVRALWAGVPFVWQLYPQQDRVHAAKLDAFMTRFIDGAGQPLAAELERLFGWWNGVDSTDDGLPPPLPPHDRWRAHCAAFRDRLAEQADLTTSLIDFAASKR